MLKDIKATSKHTFIYALSNVSVKLVGLLLIPIYTNPDYLSRAEYGMLAVLEATVQLIVGILTLAMTQSLIRWYWDSEYKNQQKSIFYTSFSFLLFAIIIFWAFSIPFSDLASQITFGSTKFTYVFKLVFLISGFRVLNNQILALARIQLKSSIYTVVTILKLLVILGFTLYFLLVLDRSVKGVWEAALIGEVLIFIVLIPYAYKNSEFRFNKKILGEMLNYGFPLMLASISGILLVVADRYMLNFISGLEQTGIYSLGLRIANTLKIVISTSLLFALQPLRMKKMNSPDAPRFYSKIFTYSSFIFVYAILALSLFSLEILKVISSSTDYWESANLVPILSFALLFGLMKDNVVIGLSITKKTKIIGGLIVITSIFNIILNAALIPLFGIYGAAGSTLFSQILFFLLIYYSSQKYYSVPYEKSKNLILVAVSIVFVLLSLVIADLDTYLRVSIKLLMIVIFPFVLNYFNFYDAIEKEVLLKIMQSWLKPKMIKENIQRLLK